MCSRLVMVTHLHPFADADRHALAVARVERSVGREGEHRATFRSFEIPPPYSGEHMGRVEHIPRPEMAESAVLIDVNLMRLGVPRIAKVAGAGEQLTSRVSGIGQHPERGGPIDVDVGLVPERGEELERLHQRVLVHPLEGIRSLGEVGGVCACVWTRRGWLISAEMGGVLGADATHRGRCRRAAGCHMGGVWARGRGGTRRGWLRRKVARVGERRHGYFSRMTAVDEPPT